MIGPQPDARGAAMPDRRGLPWRGLSVAVIAALVVAGGWWAFASRARTSPAERSRRMPLEEARPVLAALSGHVPEELAEVGKLNEDLWEQWTRQHDAKIRE